MIGNFKYFIVSVWQDCNIIVALWIYILTLASFTGILFIIFSLLTGQIDTDNITWGLIDYV